MSSETSEKKFRNIQDLPGPRGLPLLGNILQLNPNRLHLILEEWCDHYGSFYKFKIASKQIIAIADSKLIHETLKARPEAYRRLSTMDTIMREMGINGVFSAEGENWRRQRHIAMQALNTDHLRDFFITFAEITQRLKRRWDAIARDGKTTEVQKDLMRYTVDITTNLAFGYDGNTLEREGNVIQQHLEKILPMINRRINAPFPYWRILKLSADRSLDRALVAIHQEIIDIVTHCKTRLENDPELENHPRNFLEAMLIAQKNEAIEFSDEDIFGNILTMLLAGEDSTANTMAWMLHFMTEYPAIQSKMQQEVDTILGDKDTLNKFEDTSQLHYIEAVAYEAMRLKSIAPIIFLEAQQDVELNGIPVPKGTALFLLTRHCAMQDEAFTEARQFKPERWMDKGGSEFPCHNTNAFIPFGAGPRFCPGRNLALLEIKTVMAMLCKNFSVTKTKESQSVEEHFSFTMNPANLFVDFDTRR